MIEAVLHIESQSNQKLALEKSMKELLQDLKKRANITEHSFGEVREEDVEGQVSYSSILEIKVILNFRDFVNLVIFSGPSAIEVLSVDEKLQSSKLLLILGDLSSVIEKFSKRYGISLKYQRFKELQEEVGISEEEMDELLNKGGFLTKLVVEVEGPDEESLKRATLKLLNSAGGYVSKMNSKRMEGEGWRGLVGSEVVFSNLEEVFMAVARFTPVAITIEEPDEITLSMREVQNIGLDIAMILSDLTTSTIRKRE
ncbi:MAG: hypothetical protein ACE5K0_06835 [Candidatus Methanofastidiosia archaeon]